MVTWLQFFQCPGTTKLFSGEGQEIRLMACPGVMYARKGNERGFFINMTGVLWLSGLLADHQRDHFILMLKLHDCVADRVITGYVWQFLNGCVEWGGLYQDVKRGIPRGASPSPLLGAFYLLDLDRRMEGLDVKYFRYMDGVLILAPTRWKLKKAIPLLNETFNELKLEKLPDRTSQ